MQTAQSDDLATKMPGRDPVIGLLFSEQGSKFFFILRWIILVPASIALALLLQFSMLDSLESLLNEIGVFPDSIAFKVLFKISCILLGAIYIDIGMRIAPAYKKNAALVLLGFCYLSSVLLLYKMNTDSPLICLLYCWVEAQTYCIYTRPGWYPKGYSLIQRKIQGLLQMMGGRQ